MPVKIRLQRHGKKGKPFYHVVVADARAKRDGKFIEKLGTYNPNTNPATVILNLDNAVKWLENGAQPTDTARTILSKKGAMLKKHLNGGVKKGALTEEQAEAKFNAWLEDKEDRITKKADAINKAIADAKVKVLDNEKKINEDRISRLADKNIETEATEEVLEESAPVIEESSPEEKQAE